MLRRCFQAPSVATAASFFCAAASPLASQRNIVVFSEQSDTLVNHARYKGYTLTVWHEHADLWFLKKEGLSLKEGNTDAVTAQVDRRIELYNVGQYREQPGSTPLDLPATESHSSFRSRQPYSKSFQTELQARADALGLSDSKYWLTSKEAAKNNLQLKSGDMRSSTAIIARVNSKLYCAEQFNDPKLAATLPVSGLSKKPFGAEMSKALRAVIAERSFSTGLFFTPKQLDLFELRSLVKPGEAPVSLPMSLITGGNRGGPTISNSNSNNGKSSILYSLADVVNCDAIMKEVNRFPVDEPSYFGSGKPLGSTATIKAKALLHARGHTTSGARNYFVSDSECQRRGWKLVEDAVGLEQPNFSSGSSSSSNITIELFNADQLSDPAQAFRVAGTKA